jgi:ADP-heptose:LPS heptosyltransferase
MKKAILTLCVGELYWELARFVPYIIWRKINEPDLDIIVMSREDRFDLYGQYATKFIPISVEGDCYTKKAECFRLNGFTNIEYLKLINDQYELIKNDYDIVEKVFPKMEQFSKTYQFDRNKFCYDYKPRKENKEIIDNLKFDKPIIVIAPRFRQGIPRNWINWEKFYDLLKTNKDFEFVLCGKEPEYIKDNYFFDINNLSKIENTSLIGYTIELIKKAKLVVGSQSAIPSLSLLLNTQVLQWGHNRINLMTQEYNPLNTKCCFLDDHKYSRSANDIYNEMIKILK